MFESVLVANRGEIACRVFRTAKAMGLRTIAVYSEADAQALHAQMADEAYLLGPAPATQSYLNVAAILDVAKQASAQSIHPGYGFLSENAEFAQACMDAGIAFIGPPAQAIAAMGSKMMSKRLMEEAGVPILPGYHGDDQSDATLSAEADKVGYPLLIKASAGGGGKGMRIVEDAASFADQLAAARREAKAAFSDDAVLLERYLTSPKHIEVQLMADQHGNVVHLFERDCSVQRRHQKVVEEAPGPTISPELRASLGETAVQAAKKVNYVGAGTVEFIAEDDEFFFMEMNTRLQVEHPVTEAITGLDLVRMQLEVAAGERLSVEQSQITLQGHAIEVRLYAENPSKKFLPATGTLVAFDMPAALRVDTGVQAGSEVTMHYDPMLAKLIAHGETRKQALVSLVAALGQTQVAGVEHNLGYLTRLLKTPQFEAGDYTTSLADDVHDDVVPRVSHSFAVAGARWLTTSIETDVWGLVSGLRLNAPSHMQVSLRQGKQAYDVVLSGDDTFVNGDLTQAPEQAVEVVCVANTMYVMSGGHTERFLIATDDMSRYANITLSAGGITAPMPGQVIALKVKVGDKVKQGDELVVVEAMKMEHVVTAPKSGTVSGLLCEVGARVDDGSILLELD